MQTKSLLLFAVIAMSLGAFLQAADEKKVVWVSPTGGDGGDGSKEKPCRFEDIMMGETKQVEPGTTIMLAGGVYLPSSPNSNKELAKITPRIFQIHLNGTKDSPIMICGERGKMVHLNGHLEVTGSHLRLRDIEVGIPDAVPTRKYPSTLHIGASQDIQIINCNFFGGGSTLAAHHRCKNLLLYGLLLHDSCNLPHGGSNLYIQNGPDSTKVIEHCIAYRSSAYNVGIHVYSENKATNITYTENIIFCGGERVEGRNQDNIYINPGSPGSNIKLVGNVAYQAQTACDWRPNTRFSSKRNSAKYDYTNENIILRDNWFMGGLYAASFGRWKRCTFIGNTIWAEQLMIDLSSTGLGNGIRPQKELPNLAAYTFEQNRYAVPQKSKAFRYARSEDIDGGEPLLSFNEWQHLGLDQKSTLLPVRNGRPIGMMIRIFPNKFEKGRANIAVFNWDRQKQVSVDLSTILDAGQSFRIYNCADITQTIRAAHPIMTTVYRGGKISLPLRIDKATPDFNAFLVLPN